MSTSHDHRDHDEPKTPMWLPALGGVLFLGAGVWWATLPGEPSASAAPTSLEGGAAMEAGPALDAGSLPQGRH